jgi:transcriptional repressor NrdR
MEDIIAGIERELFARGENEVPASLVGEKLMEALKTLDPVAYIRFASVYRSFRDVESFQAELAELLAK